MDGFETLFGLDILVLVEMHFCPEIIANMLRQNYFCYLTLGDLYIQLFPALGE